jgi:hypothetical protein
VTRIQSRPIGLQIVLAQAILPSSSGVGRAKLGGKRDLPQPEGLAAGDLAVVILRVS